MPSCFIHALVSSVYIRACLGTLTVFYCDAEVSLLLFTGRIVYGLSATYKGSPLGEKWTSCVSVRLYHIMLLLSTTLKSQSLNSAKVYFWLIVPAYHGEQWSLIVVTQEPTLMEHPPCLTSLTTVQRWRDSSVAFPSGWNAMPQKWLTCHFSHLSSQN